MGFWLDLSPALQAKAKLSAKTKSSLPEAASDPWKLTLGVAASTLPFLHLFSAVEGLRLGSGRSRAVGFNEE